MLIYLVQGFIESYVTRKIVLRQVAKLCGGANHKKEAYKIIFSYLF